LSLDNTEIAIIVDGVPLIFALYQSGSLPITSGNYEQQNCLQLERMLQNNLYSLSRGGGDDAEDAITSTNPGMVLC